METKAVIADKAIAKQVLDLANQAFYRIDESALAVRNNSNPEETDTYLEAIAPIIGSIIFNILEPLYEQHPDLKPANWDAT